MNEIMIEARGITKSYGQVTVLSGVDLDIEKHKITSISGASGAGKTTLLQILGTLNAPDAGSLTIGGTRVDGLKGNALSAFRNQRIGFIFQLICFYTLRLIMNNTTKSIVFGTNVMIRDVFF